METRTKIFISYSHADERWRKRIAGHLAVLALEGIIDLWDDRQLEAGDDWLARIHEQMLHARIALLLISSDFLTSKFIREEEVPKLFQRHELGGMTVYPLLVKPCPWQEVGWLSRLQVRPREGRPLASYRGVRVDEIMVEVALEISSLARGPSEGTPRAEESRALVETSPADLSGGWVADVTYDWPNAKYPEVFQFTTDGGEVSGTASFLGVKRGLVEGRIEQDRLNFVTRTQEALGDGEPREVRHRYRGKLAGDEIRFSLQTEGGYSEHLPIEFTARRVRETPVG